MRTNNDPDSSAGVGIDRDAPGQTRPIRPGGRSAWGSQSFPGGAKGIRTPDPHTASVVRYQLRHSPEMCLSKLHHGLPAIKVADQTASSNAESTVIVEVSGANTQTTAATSMMTPLTVKPQAKLKCSAI